MIGLNTSLAGILRGVSRLEDSAGRIAKGAVRGAAPAEDHTTVDQVDLSREALELLEAEHQVAVNAKVVARLAETQDALFEGRRG